MKKAELIIDGTDKNVDLFYLSGFWAPDAFIYFRVNGKKYLMLSDLEIDRAKKNSCVDAVLSLTKYIKKAETKKNKNPGQLDAAMVALKEKGVKKVVVPTSMSFLQVDKLRKNGFKVEAGPVPFEEKRLLKDKREKALVLRSQKHVFSAMKLAEDMIKKSVIKKNMLYLGGKPLTSERVREALHRHLYDNGCIASEGTIVACGMDAIDPHNFGTGILRPNKAIIVDIFPRSVETQFWGDATRTFCKGKAPAELKRLYNAVKTAQVGAIKKIRAGMNGKKIHQEILDYFEKQGYKTGEMDGRRQGFFHSTGHGIGLELHEAPTRIGPIDYTLKAGMICSVEPGLYYKKIGGVRIEDLVYVTKKGCEILSSYPKVLEIK